MCDTIVALPEATADGAMLLAKNADTEVNEAQQILRYPAHDYLPARGGSCDPYDDPAGAPYA